MIVPYAHVATLEEAAPEELAEMMSLARKAEAVLRRVYNAEGLNIGHEHRPQRGRGSGGSHPHAHAAEVVRGT